MISQTDPRGADQLYAALVSSGVINLQDEQPPDQAVEDSEAITDFLEFLKGVSQNESIASTGPRSKNLDCASNGDCWRKTSADQVGTDATRCALAQKAGNSN
ncbi:MAG: hypothetical protein U0350_05985 [Caldilineaceae bacterium]